MKLVIVAMCLVLAVLAEDHYDSINDDYNIDEVIDNKRLMEAYAKCLLDEGSCTSEVKQVKEKLPDALATNCKKCTDKQKQKAKKLVQAVRKSRPDLWDKLVKKYDPQGEYQKAFSDFLE